MAQARNRFQRFVLLLAALCVLVLLLELNRFLPGAWPGGGAGFRTRQPATASTAATLPEVPPDTAAVAAPQEAPPDWPPPDGLRIEVRGPDGALQTRWRLSGGELDGAAPDSRGRLRTPTPPQDGFRVLTDAGVLRHEHGLEGRVGAWVITLPGAPLPRQREPGRAGVLVVDAATGAPIEGARVTWLADGADRETTTDATGEAVVRGGRDGRAVGVLAEAPGRASGSGWASPRSTQPLRLALEQQREVRTTLRFPAAQPDPDGEMSAVLLRLEPPTGPVEATCDWSLERPDEVAVRAAVPAGAARDTWVHVVVERTGAPPYHYRERLDRLPPDGLVAADRVIDVEVRDAQGRPVEGAAVEAPHEPREEGEPGDTLEPLRNRGRTDARGHARLAVPDGSPFVLRVEAPAMEPAVRRFTATDGTAPLPFVLTPGLAIPVRVVDGDGKAVAGAEVLARTAVEGVRIQHAATTDAEGRASVGPFGRGPVEVFVGSPRHAWSAALVDAQAAMGTVDVTLKDGHPLQLVVEDPFGTPLPGVQVSVTPADGGAPLVAPPDEAAWRTDDDGRLAIPALPNRLYDVELSLPGYPVERLRRVQPGAVTYFATLVR